jgi:MFS family permease
MAGNTATAMRELAATWLMTSLAPSAFAVGMVKAAASLPILLLALPAGALADRLNRRHLALSVNLVLAIVAAGLGVAIIADCMTPWLLVAAIFVAGIGSAILQPTDQSLVPLTVEPALLEPAVALNGTGLNLARALGPALAGLVVAGLGMAAAFFANVLGYLVVIAAFIWWTGAGARANDKVAVQERFAMAVMAGVRFVRSTPDFQRVLWRAGCFVFVASAYWTLLPLLVRRELGGSPGLYAVLLACIGGGTVVTAFALPVLRQRLSTDAVFRLGSGATALALALFACLGNAYAVAAAAVLAGAAWLVALTVANVAAQALLADPMRGRGMAFYLMVFGGAMSAGSLCWALLADQASVRVALGVAAAAGLAGLVLGWRRPLPEA